MAPNGDAAYATFKATAEGESKTTPIRIGEGYPTEDPEGWSSVSIACIVFLFVIRSIPSNASLMVLWTAGICD